MAIVEPSGETAGLFSPPPLDVTNREVAGPVSVLPTCTPGLGRGSALTTRRLSGSQLKAATICGRSATGAGTVRGVPFPSGKSQSSLKWPAPFGPLTQAASVEPSGEK